jgi:hypothetical protein
MKIGIDLDGVVADFETAFKAAATQYLGFTDFREEWDMGLSHQDADKLLQTVLKKQPDLWLNLGTYLTYRQITRLCKLAIKNDLYFITSRKSPKNGPSAQYQSQHWLEGLGIPGAVIVTEQKGYICSYLGIDYFIDDRPSFCDAVQSYSCNTKTFILDRRYNRMYSNAYVKRVTFDQFLKAIK